MADVTRRAHGTSREPLLEGLAAAARYRRSLSFIDGLRRSGTPVRGIDLGCGHDGAFVRRAGRLGGVQFAGGDTNVRPGAAELFMFDFRAPAPPPFTPNVVTLHAVLEHLDDPEAAMRYVHQILAPGGYVVLTVPSQRAKPILEFLAFRLGLISRVEIADHKRYYDRDSVVGLLQRPDAEFADIAHRYFQLGLNNFATARKAG